MASARRIAVASSGTMPSGGNPSTPDQNSSEDMLTASPKLATATTATINPAFRIGSSYRKSA
jgi:hypothetical protein